LEISRTQRLLTMAQTTGGKMLVPLNYHAARTGRFGGSESINVQNLKKGSLIRRAIRAPDGFKLVSADASQIEARLVGWLAGCRNLTDAFRGGRDVYSEFASVAFNRPINKDDNPVERQTGKVSVLQLGYQSGGAKLQKKLEASGVVVDLATATFYVDTYRKAAYPEVPAMWYHAERLLRWCIQRKQAEQFMIEGLLFTHRGIKLPSDRWLLYDQMRIGEGGVPEYYDTRYKMYKQLYGGRIIENISQSLARDVVTGVHAKFLDVVVMQEHDSLTLLVPAERAQEYYDDLIADMSLTPPWARHPVTGDLPLAAEGYVSEYYAKPVVVRH
jgi:DNA polymerase